MPGRLLNPGHIQVLTQEGGWTWWVRYLGLRHMEAFQPPKACRSDWKTSLRRVEARQSGNCQAGNSLGYFLPQLCAPIKREILDVG